MMFRTIAGKPVFIAIASLAGMFFLGSAPLTPANPAAFAEAPPARFPKFQWDTVPVYIHFGKNSGPLSDEEARLVAETSDFVSLEKGHARRKFGTTEEGIAFDAKRLKRPNPNMKVLC